MLRRSSGTWTRYLPGPACICGLADVLATLAYNLQCCWQCRWIPSGLCPALTFLLRCQDQKMTTAPHTVYSSEGEGQSDNDLAPPGFTGLKTMDRNEHASTDDDTPMPRWAQACQVTPFCERSWGLCCSV